MADDRCWICLGTDGEIPPLGDPSESKELVSPCGCSLRVHQKCLLDWTASVAMKSTQDGDFRLKRCNNPEFIVRDETGSHVITLRPTTGLKIYTNEELRCPQCKTLYKLTCKPSLMLRFSNLVQYFSKTVGSYVIWSTAGSVIAGSVMVSIYSLLSSLGFKLIQRVAPMSVVMKLLNINERNLDNALLNNKVGFKHLSLMSGFPIFLLSLRSDNRVSTMIRNLYPLFYFNNILEYKPKDVRNFLVLSEPIYQIYKYFFKLTFNRFHYRLLIGINTCFLGNKFPVEEIEQIDQENQEFLELEYKRNQENANSSLINKIKNYLFPNYSKEERDILRKRHRRETESILKNDYSNLIDKSKIITLITTFLWPLSGEVIGKLLVKIKFVQQFSNNFTNTPDESTYLINLFGCCLAVLIKDLFNLYVAWKYCKQYKDIHILDSRFQGFELVPREEKKEDPILENIPGAWVQQAVAADEENGDLIPNNENFDFDHLEGNENRIVINLNYGDMLNRMIEAFDNQNNQN